MLEFKEYNKFIKGGHMQDQCQGEKYVYFKGIGDDRMKTGLPDKRFNSGDKCGED